MHKSPEALILSPLIPKIRAELIAILESLSDVEWQAPTVCTGWSVRDVAAHILGDDFGLLSNMRDKDGRYHKVDSWEALVNLINEQNAVWVAATRRLSRRVLLDLLQKTGAEVHELFLSIDPYQMGSPIGWAGTEPDPMWLHIAREFTEYWTHHQHICEAVGRVSLKEEIYLRAVIATFVHALPRTFGSVSAPTNSLIRFEISNIADLAWDLLREENRWRLYQQTALPASSTIRMSADTAWRLFTKNQDVETILKAKIQITGDTALGAIILNTIAIIA